MGDDGRSLAFINLKKHKDELEDGTAVDKLFELLGMMQKELQASIHNHAQKCRELSESRGENRLLKAKIKGLEQEFNSGSINDKDNLEELFEARVENISLEDASTGKKVMMELK